MCSIAFEAENESNESVLLSNDYELLWLKVYFYFLPMQVAKSNCQRTGILFSTEEPVKQQG